MKPPVDWSPCQQLGLEHNWLKESSVYQSGWFCIKCGIRVFEVDEDG